jgi:hypothetical protein
MQHHESRCPIYMFAIWSNCMAPQMHSSIASAYPPIESASVSKKKMMMIGPLLRYPGQPSRAP